MKKFNSQNRPYLIGIAMVLILSSHWLAGASFQGLGDLSGGTFQSIPNAISADGKVVVGSSLGDGFRWKDGNLTGLGDLPGGAISSSGRDASADGSIVVGSSSILNSSEAFRWENDEMVGLGILTGGLSSSALSVSSDGSIIMGISTTSMGVITAVKWEDTGIEGIGEITGMNVSNLSVSDASPQTSTFVGTHDDVNANEFAFSWQNDTLTSLPDFDGGSSFGGATAISEDGSIIVGFGTTATGRKAARWVGGAISDIDPTLGFSSTASGISNNGMFIVGSFFPPTGEEAFIWDETNQTRSITQILTGLGLAADIQNWTLQKAVDVSDNGQVITGWGTNPSGNIEAWIANIVDGEIVPMNEGWNLISVSKTPQQNSVATIFSDPQKTSQRVWTFRDGQLVLANTVNPEEAYWVFSFDGSNITVK